MKKKYFEMVAAEKGIVHVQGKQFHPIYSQGATQSLCVTDVIL